MVLGMSLYDFMLGRNLKGIQVEPLQTFLPGEKKVLSWGEAEEPFEVLVSIFISKSVMVEPRVKRK